MKFAYLEDGTVAGLNRAGVAPELTGNCTPQELVWGMVVEMYTAPSGHLTPKSADYKYELELKSQLSTDLASVDADVLKEQSELFFFNGHNYHPDERSLHAVLTGLPYQADEWTKVWKTADKEADGVSNLYVTLTKAEMAGLGMGLFDRQASIWESGDVKKRAIKEDYNSQEG